MKLPVNAQLGAPVYTEAPAEQVQRLIERLAFQANHAAKSRGPEAVHDLRVAIRRLDQALRVFGDDLPRKIVKKIRKQLKAVLGAAGTLRNWDIAAKILAKSRQSSAAALLATVHGSRKEAERTLLALLRSLSLRTRVSKWRDDLELDALRAETSPQALPDLAAATLPRLAERFFELGQAAARQGSGEELHDFRIFAKKFRYTLELFVPVYGAAAEAWLREIKSVQSVLGDMNDYRTVLAMAQDANRGQKLQAALKRGERRKAARFRSMWHERFPRSLEEHWTAAFAAPPSFRSARKPMGSTTSSSAHKSLTAKA